MWSALSRSSLSCSQFCSCIPRGRHFLLPLAWTGFPTSNDPVAIFGNFSFAMSAVTAFYLMESMVVGLRWFVCMNVGALVSLVAAFPTSSRACS